MTTAGYHYRVIRAELTQIADDLTPEQAATAVPALPGWTVLDTFAHLAGISNDFVQNNPANINDPAWSAGHIAARAGRTLPELTKEWTANGPTVEAILDDPAGKRLIFALFDIFHHGHDIRGALGRREARDTPEAAYITMVMTKLKRAGWGERPPIEFSTGSGHWRLGAETGEPSAALATSDFELSRILIGRRSRTQMLAAGWSGDPEPIVDFLPSFGPPVTDLTE